MSSDLDFSDLSREELCSVIYHLKSEIKRLVKDLIKSKTKTDCYEKIFEYFNDFIEIINRNTEFKDLLTKIKSLNTETQHFVSLNQLESQTSLNEVFSEESKQTYLRSDYNSHQTSDCEDTDLLYIDQLDYDLTGPPIREDSNVEIFDETNNHESEQKESVDQIEVSLSQICGHSNAKDINEDNDLLSVEEISDCESTDEQKKGQPIVESPVLSPGKPLSLNTWREYSLRSKQKSVPNIEGSKRCKSKTVITRVDQIEKPEDSKEVKHSTKNKRRLFVVNENSKKIETQTEESITQIGGYSKAMDISEDCDLMSTEEFSDYESTDQPIEEQSLFETTDLNNKLFTKMKSMVFVKPCYVTLNRLKTQISFDEILSNEPECDPRPDDNSDICNDNPLSALKETDCETILQTIGNPSIVATSNQNFNYISNDDNSHQSFKDSDLLSPEEVSNYGSIITNIDPTNKTKASETENCINLSTISKMKSNDLRSDHNSNQTDICSDRDLSAEEDSLCESTTTNSDPTNQSKISETLNVSTNLKRTSIRKSKKFKTIETQNNDNNEELIDSSNKKVVTKPEKSKLFICDFEGCGYKSNQNCHLTRHKLKHSNERPLKCKFCGKPSKNIGDAKKHLLGVHPERFPETPYIECPQNGCKFKTKLPSYMPRHQNSHTLPVVCEFCQKRFANNGGLRDHLPTHSSAKDYVCPICNKAFERLPALSKHKKLHNKKLFVCDFKGCEKSFVFQSRLQKHKTSEHQTN